MTTLTAIILASRDDLHIDTFSEDGLWGFEISYGYNHQPCVTSKPHYENQKMAEDGVNLLIQEAKAWIKSKID